MSAVATAGAAAWVVPEILTAKPAAGAALSGNGSTGGSAGVSDQCLTRWQPAPAGPSVPTERRRQRARRRATAADTTAAGTDPSSLAFTGLNIQRDAEVGAALVAGGWAMQHWASRAVKPAAAGTSDAHQAESAGDGA